MKSKRLFAMLLALVLNGCEQKNAAIRNELRIIEKTAEDATQSQYVRDSAGVFMKILSEKQGIPRFELWRSHVEMLRSPEKKTIVTYVAFLKALEKKIPDELLSEETYLAMKSKAGSEKIIEYNVAQTTIMMSNSIQNITLYNDPAADAEVEGVLKRLTEKHGASETGKKILKLLNMVRENGLADRARGIKPWESPRRTDTYID